MRGTQLSRAYMMLELARLLRVHKRPAWAPDDIQAFAGDYVAICDDVSAEQMTQAVTSYLKSSARFFPKPGELRVLARDQRGLDIPGADPESFDEWMRRGCEDQHGRFSPCPACGRAWQAQPRVTLVHDHARHRAAGLPCIGSCDEPTCLGTYAVPQRCAPTAVSAGEVWVAPGSWTSDLPARAKDPRPSLELVTASPAREREPGEEPTP